MFYKRRQNKRPLATKGFSKEVSWTKIDFEDGDTSKQKMLFLSETIAKYSVNEPKSKVEVISTKVSGQSDGFGFSSPQIFSFYQNNINLGSLNPRGFISPIADNALNYYRYKFAGSFFENNQMVNRIQVMPKRNYEPLFNGFINIIENEWRIHSVQLKLFKENQMQLADTLIIEQLYVPYGNTWLIKQQTIFPSIKMLALMLMEALCRFMISSISTRCLRKPFLIIQSSRFTTALIRRLKSTGTVFARYLW